jgi:ZIP family zinc transporter
MINTGYAYLDVAIYALITAIFTGFGAIPFFFIKNITQKWLGVSNAIASGLMLAASFGLIYEGIDYNVWYTMAGVIGGLIFITLSRNYMQNYDELSLANMDQANTFKVLLIMGVMTIHSAAEGIGVGVSFSGGQDLGIFITTAIAIHNIPEGLAISLVMVPRGTSPLKAAGWSVFSSLPQPLMAIPAFLFIEVFKTYLPVGLGFAAGAMIWMVFSELIPEALDDAESNTVAIYVTVSAAAMTLFQVLMNT